MADLWGVAVKDIDEAWPVIRADLDRVIDVGHGHYDAAAVRAKIEATDWQLWVAFEDKRYLGFVVTEIRVWPRCRTLEAVLLAGEDADRVIAETQDKLKDFARAHGCVALEMRGRFGWKRVLQRHGWTVGDVIGRLPL